MMEEKRNTKSKNLMVILNIIESRSDIIKLFFKDNILSKVYFRQIIQKLYLKLYLNNIY